MLLAILRTEQTKLYGRKTIWIELALVASLIVLMYGVVYLALQSGEIPRAERAMVAELLTLPNGVKIALTVASNQILGALLMTVLVSMAVAQEYTWQTYTLAIRAGVPRHTVLIGKFITLLVPALLLAVTALLAGTIMTTLLTISVDGQLSLSQVNWADLIVSTLVTAYSLLPYMALTFLVAVLTRSVPASLGVVAGYVFLVEGIVPQVLMLFGGLPAQLAHYMPGQLATALLNANGQTMAMQSAEAGATAPVFQGASPEAAVIAIAAYTVVFLAIAAARFQKQDLSS